VITIVKFFGGPQRGDYYVRYALVRVKLERHRMQCIMYNIYIYICIYICIYILCFYIRFGILGNGQLKIASRNKNYVQSTEIRSVIHVVQP